LLAHPAIDINALDKFWFTPLSFTIYWGMTEATDMLLGSPHFDAGSANGWTPLHLAVTSGNDELVLWLINQPQVKINLCDKHGRQAVAFAAAFGSKAILQAFLTRDPTQITHKDFFGNGLLHMASFGSNRENFSLLFS
ncbi:ankyrin, partial [Periconia macrospinosa]